MRRSDAIQLRMIMILTLFIIFGIMFLFIKSSYLNHPVSHMKSAPYTPSPGCIIKRYVTADEISPACANSVYIIPSDTARSYDWDVGRANLDYYRVGDDAYQIECGQFNSRGCKVNLTQYNAFSR